MNILLCLVVSVAHILCCVFSGADMESEASSADHHAAVTSTGPSGGEDLHRQVRNDLTFKHRSKLII